MVLTFSIQQITKLAEFLAGEALVSRKVRFGMHRHIHFLLINVF